MRIRLFVILEDVVVLTKNLKYFSAKTLQGAKEKNKIFIELEEENARSDLLFRRKRVARNIMDSFIAETAELIMRMR